MREREEGRQVQPSVWGRERKGVKRQVNGICCTRYILLGMSKKGRITLLLIYVIDLWNITPLQFQAHPTGMGWGGGDECQSITKGSNSEVETEVHSLKTLKNPK